MRSQFVRTLWLALSFVTVTGAASAQQGDRNKITRDEILQAPGIVYTALDAVRVLRPQWLQQPLGRVASSNVLSGGGGATELVVYVDNVRQNALDELRTVPRNSIWEMKFLDQNRAVIMHGPGHEMGCIEVTTVYKRP